MLILFCIVDPSQSSTATELGSGFSIHYVTPGSGVAGNYIADNFGIGDLIVQNLTMAVVTSARHVDTGLMESDMMQMNRCHQAPTHIPTLLTIWWRNV